MGVPPTKPDGAENFEDVAELGGTESSPVPRPPLGGESEDEYTYTEDAPTAVEDSALPLTFSEDVPPERSHDPGAYFDSRYDETWKLPEGKTWSTHFIRADTPLSYRQKEAARLIWLGKKQKEVCETLGMSQSWMSQLVAHPKFREEIERLRDKAFEITINERLKEMGPAATNVIEEILTSTDQNKIKYNIKADTAKWVIEKLTGKPKQEVEVQETSLNRFLDLLNEVKQNGGELKDVGPAEPEAEAVLLEAGESGDATQEPQGDTDTSPNFTKWLDENL